MRIFVTEAPGFIGSALIPKLLKAGHQVLGLDLDSLRAGAAQTEGVIHLAFKHDFSQFQRNCDDDRKGIEVIGEVLVGSNRPFVFTSGTAA